MGKTKQPKSGAEQAVATSQTLEELIREQGVQPIHDLDDLGALWPDGDDPQRFDEFLGSERSRRRNAHP
jgi:hypothetical protein